MYLNLDAEGEQINRLDAGNDNEAEAHKEFMVDNGASASDEASDHPIEYVDVDTDKADAVDGETDTAESKPTKDQGEIVEDEPVEEAEVMQPEIDELKCTAHLYVETEGEDREGSSVEGDKATITGQKSGVQELGDKVVGAESVPGVYIPIVPNSSQENNKNVLVQCVVKMEDRHIARF